MLLFPAYSAYPPVFWDTAVAGAVWLSLVGFRPSGADVDRLRVVIKNEVRYEYTSGYARRKMKNK